jgi:hypothetical protein
MVKRAASKVFVQIPRSRSVAGLRKNGNGNCSRSRPSMLTTRPHTRPTKHQRGEPSMYKKMHAWLCRLGTSPPTHVRGRKPWKKTKTSSRCQATSSTEFPILWDRLRIVLEEKLWASGEALCRGLKNEMNITLGVRNSNCIQSTWSKKKKEPRVIFTCYVTDHQS